MNLIGRFKALGSCLRRYDSGLCPLFLNSQQIKQRKQINNCSHAGAWEQGELVGATRSHAPAWECLTHNLGSRASRTCHPHYCLPYQHYFAHQCLFPSRQLHHIHPASNAVRHPDRFMRSRGHHAIRQSCHFTARKIIRRQRHSSRRGQRVADGGCAVKRVGCGRE